MNPTNNPLETSIAASQVPGPVLELVPPPTLEEQLARVTAELEEGRKVWAREKANAAMKVEIAEKDLAAAKEQILEMEQNPLTFALANCDEGSVLMDAGEELQRVLTAVAQFEGKGVFTLKIEVKPGGRGMEFKPVVTVKLPKPEPMTSIFFMGENGLLQRNDPRQRELWEERRAGRGRRDDQADER